jgi:hypothetical protein
MQFTTTSSAAVAAVILGLVAAKSSNIPSCAQDCISQYTSGGNPIGNCTGPDVACICRNSTFINQVSCCVDGSCDSSDRDNAINYARGVCSAAGVFISNDDARCNAANATTTGGGGAGAGATTSTVTTTGTTSDATTTGTFTSTSTTTGTGGAASPTNTGAPNAGSRPGAYALGVGAIGGAVAAGMMILV